MKKKSIIQVLKTIRSICDSYDYCQLCVLDGYCPFNKTHKANTNNVDQVAEIIKNTMDGDQNNDEKC